MEGREDFKDGWMKGGKGGRISRKDFKERYQGKDSKEGCQGRMSRTEGRKQRHQGRISRKEDRKEDRKGGYQDLEGRHAFVVRGHEEVKHVP
jgi:hypothetical protein